MFSVHRCLANTHKKVCYFFPSPHRCFFLLPPPPWPFLSLPLPPFRRQPCHGNPVKLCVHSTHFQPLEKKKKKTHSSVHIALQKNCRPRHLNSAFHINILKVMTAWRLNTSKEQQQRRCDKRKFGEFVNIVESKQTQTGLSRMAAEPEAKRAALACFLPP